MDLVSIVMFTNLFFFNFLELNLAWDSVYKTALTRHPLYKSDQPLHVTCKFTQIHEHFFLLSLSRSFFPPEQTVLSLICHLNLSQ